MKKFISILIFSLLIVGCEENVIGDFDGEAAVPITDESSITALSEEEKASKKGASFTNSAKAWSHKTSDLQVHWMYSWGWTLKEEIPENVEFVPMFWGKGSVTDERIAEVKQLIAEGKVKYVLGFNEPDGAAQANMSVDEAIALWPKLESLGVPLGSPATVNPLNNWMKEFMSRAEVEGLRVDFVAMHHYGGPNVISFINKLKDTRKAYDKRIWITEFGVADWNASSPANNRYSEEEVLDFMQQALPALDDIDWIYRYCWFPFGQDSAPGTSSALFDSESNLTTLGEFYSEQSPNLEVGPGQDTEFIPSVEEGELIVNGHFETGRIEPWAGFKNKIRTNDVQSGKFCGEVTGGDGSLIAFAPVEPGKTYILKYISKWTNTPPISFGPMLRNNDGNALLLRLPEVPTETTWQESSHEYTIPDGVTDLKIVFYKTTGPSYLLDDVSLKLKE